MFGIAVIIIAIMLAVGGIIYGLGFAFDNKKIKEFGFSELIQSVINGAILFLLFMAFSRIGIVTQIINQLTGNLSTTAALFCGPNLSYNYGLCVTYNYLVGSTFIFSGNVTSSLLSQITILLGILLLLYITIGTVATVGFSLFGLISFKLTALTVFLTPINLIIEFLSTSLMIIFVQAAIIYAIAIATPFLLYIGLTLRTFYFTRRLGGAILAIAIGFFTIFPLTYVMNISIAQSLYPSALLPSLESTMQNFESLMLSFSKSTIFSLGEFYLSHTITPNYNSITNVSSILNIYSNNLSSMQNFANQFNGLIGELMQYVSYVIMSIFLLPLLSLILTIISIREFARILGSEISFGRFDIF
ncbi:MAG: hypothetical protein M1538_03335 [Candidatus Marsarchaeota archaeon]|jgi:hypothetical protein|nr:hypothetical protein [Candidatus Marsarchaeota archaeon]